ncbi:hypothetical protein [Streptomyces niger]|uniref:hypothetical protein n=1 Tax=Streptomyces niger TaxID=66373 RepID=UPI00069A8EC1|nr:hypothetical protein [Streptomyces niger]
MPSTVTELREPSNNTTDDMQMASLPPLPGGHGCAVLVAQLEAPQFLADPRSELTDILAPYLLRQGFKPISDTATAPPPLERWLAVLTQVPGIEVSGSLLTIVDDNAEVFFTGPVFTPTRWRRTALEAGECTLYYGPTQIDPASRDFPTQNRLLEAAAKDGRLLGARVPCTDRATLRNAAANE